MSDSNKPNEEDPAVVHQSDAPDDSAPGLDDDVGDSAHSESEMPMPPSSHNDGATDSSDTPANEKTLPPPPSFGRQMIQLVAVPALICLVAVGGVWLLTRMMPAADTIETVLLRLRMPSGGGKIGMGLKDPRYQERCRAALTLAEMLPKLENNEQRSAIGDELISILNETVGEDEKELQSYLLLGIGQLGPEGGLEEIMSHRDSEHGLVRFSAARAVSAWPDPSEARTTIDDMKNLVEDDEAMVSSEAARVLGLIATPDDTDVIGSLRRATSSPTLVRRQVHWNASIALARLGDKYGATVVTDLLLSRVALAEQPAAISGPLMQQKMSAADQDMVIISTLLAVRDVTDEKVWDKIAQLAEDDPSLSVRKTAKQLTESRKKEGANSLVAPD